MEICRRLMSRGWCLVVLVLPAAAVGQSNEDRIVDAANAVLRETMTLPAERIPQKLLSDAWGIAIVPNTVKGGFVIGVRHGRGVILARAENGEWQAPTFVTLTGGSVGWQAGVQSTDVILVFRTRKGLESLFRNKLTLGVDAGVAAGPAGRQASAATDLALQAEILSYSRSRGLFAGVALDGAAMAVDTAASSSYYAAATAAGAAFPASAARLLATLHEYSRPESTPPGTVVAAAQPLPGQLVPVQPMPGQLAPGQLAPSQPLPAPAAPAAVQPPAAAAEAVRQQLALANGAMNQVLDDTWRQFLALPPGLTTPGQAVPYQVLVDTLARYDKVVADPQYAALAQRPEFAAVRRLLQDYTSLMTANSNARLELPQPPTVANGVP